MEILRHKAILLAAADEEVSGNMAKAFTRAGSQVLSATGGFEAYEFARVRRVDAVVTCPRLSSGDPYQLLSDVRRLNYDIPVILFGDGEGVSPTEAVHRGFAGYYRQASSIDVIVQAVARSLE